MSIVEEPGKPRAKQDQPVLLEAIDLTLRTIEARARSFRNLVVAVTLVVIASILATIVLRQPWLLAGLLLPIAFVAAFARSDRRAVEFWRQTIAAMVAGGKLDIMVFRKTLLQFKHLPQLSVQAMLDLILTG